MVQVRFLCFAMLLFLCFSCKTSSEPNARAAKEVVAKKLANVESLHTIAFGSCNRQDEPQDMWSFVVASRPDLWIWLGDNIYGDTDDMKIMARKYRKLKNNRKYRRLLATCPVIGIWDDHDFGVNDGGKEFSAKAESKKLMLDFLDVPRRAAVRQREGAYQSYEFGSGNKKVKIILLDTRYFRDSLVKNILGKSRYKPNEKGDILGEEQWAWLEKELTNSDASLHLIGGGIQFIPEEHMYEKWANFPNARQRFLKLLEQTRVKNAVLLSGDRHIAEVSRITLEGLDYPLYEITSSGLTHTWSKTMPGSEPNQYREGELIIQKNFGLIRIDWTGSQPVLTIQIRGLENTLYLQQTIHF